MTNRQQQYRQKPTSLMKRDEDTFDEVADMARSGYRLARKLADLVNIETKCYFHNQSTASPVPTMVTSTPSSSGMTPVIVNEVQVGDDDYQRIGDSIKLQHVDLIYSSRGQSVTGGVAGYFEYRVILFWDETNSTTLANQILEAGLLGTTLATVLTKDWDEKASTKILLDHTFRPEMLESGGQVIMYPTWHRKSIAINKHTQYEDNTQTIVTGALKLVVFTNSAVASSGFDWQCRCLFTDD